MPATIESVPLRLLIVGIFDPIHIGSHYREAARSLGLTIETCDATKAYHGPKLINRLNWWIRGHYPTRLNAFSHEVLKTCERFRPDVLLAFGLAPISAPTVARLHQLGTRRLAYLTDDPWNSAHRARWFFKSAVHYDLVFTPRKANFSDLVELGCGDVVYLPFAYAPHVHFREPGLSAEDRKKYECDVMFAGGADRDRIPYIEALIKTGLQVKLYGGYWDRHSLTRPFAQGHLNMAELRKATLAAKVTLCLVRKANRDGHAMRSFEAPAMGGCLLAEESEEHRQILGPNAAAYFGSLEEMVAQAKKMLAEPVWRESLREIAHQKVISGRNTYAHRLTEMLEMAFSTRVPARISVRGATLDKATPGL